MNLMSLKVTAFSVHLIVGFLILSAVYAYVRYNWFPGGLFELENVWSGLKILLIVDLVLGPLLTFIVYNPKKSSLKFDLTVIVLIQSLALAYGCYVISEQRPAIITFVGDRFEIITFSEGLHQNLSSRAKDTGAPPFITYALPAQTEEEKSKFIIDNYQYKYEAVRHKPIDQFIAVLSKAKLDMSNFKFASAEKEAGFQTFISSHQDKNFALFALEGTRNVAIVIAIDLDKKRVLEYLEIDPWVEYLPSMNNT